MGPFRSLQSLLVIDNNSTVTINKIPSYRRGSHPPLFILRDFLDAEFGVVLGFGFYKLADEFIKIKDIFLSSSEAYPNSPVLAINSIYSNEAFWSATGSLIMMIAILVMFVDDYARSKIITYLAPCRSIDRFSLDVIIPFFFGISFLFVSELSSLVFTSIGAAFFIGAVWARHVLVESFMWEEIQSDCSITVNSPFEARNQAQILEEKEWRFYRKRLEHIIYSHVFWVLPRNLWVNPTKMDTLRDGIAQGRKFIFSGS